MNAEKIIYSICSVRLQQGALLCARNIYLFSAQYEADVAAISKNGYIVEFEVKITRSDFFKDKKKAIKHWNLERRMERYIPNQFYYAVPDGLVKPDEVPEYAGLIYVSDGDYLVGPVSVVKVAPVLHKKKASARHFIKMARRLSYRAHDMESELIYGKQREAANV